MNKIAFVVVRYGEDINGGAEYHCKMLAERLTNNYQVEVLTTCVKNYKTGENEYAEGNEVINGVLVRRFKATPIDKEKVHYYGRKARKSVKLRKPLYKLLLLPCFARYGHIGRNGKSRNTKVVCSTLLLYSLLSKITKIIIRC